MLSYCLKYRKNTESKKQKKKEQCFQQKKWTVYDSEKLKSMKEQEEEVW